MSILLKRALDQAAVWHRDQRRKYPGADVPYVSHLMGVAINLARHGFDHEVVAAGALHDSMEDCGVEFEELERQFGRRVAELVRHVSEADKTKSWEERKAAYLDHFVEKPWDAQAITLADKLDNFVSIERCKTDFGDPWAQFKRGKTEQLERFDALLVRARRLPPHAIIDEYSAALDRLRAI